MTPSARAWPAGWPLYLRWEEGEDRETPEGLGALLDWGLSSFPRALCSVCTIFSQWRKDNVYFSIEIHSFSNFYHNGNVKSCLP